MEDIKRKIDNGRDFLKVMGFKPKAFTDKPKNQPFTQTISEVVNAEMDDIYNWDKIKLYTWISEEWDEEVQDCFEEVIKKDYLYLKENIDNYNFLDHSSAALALNYTHKINDYREELISMFIYDYLTELGIKRKASIVYELIGDGTQRLMTTIPYNELTMQHMVDMAKHIKNINEDVKRMPRVAFTK